MSDDDVGYPWSAARRYNFIASAPFFGTPWPCSCMIARFVWASGLP